MKEKVIVGLAQISPEWLNRAKTIKKVGEYIQEAAKESCDLVVFGEALIPGYPFWLEFTDAARFNSEVQKEFHAHYMREAIQPEAGDLDELCRICKEHSIATVIGTIEKAANRGGHSLYCSLVYIDKEGIIRNVHRKLMPTHEERLSWSVGDGHGLRTFPFDAFTLGALNCWENWMPPARTALYGMGEDLHVAIWPGSLRNTGEITRFIALESRSFVVSVSGMLKPDQVPADIPNAKLLLENAPEVFADGGSCIAAPDGSWVIEPVVGKEGLFTAEIDHKLVRKERHNFDPVGHYSRPDVFNLEINRKRQSIISISDE